MAAYGGVPVVMSSALLSSLAGGGDPVCRAGFDNPGSNVLIKDAINPFAHVYPDVNIGVPGFTTIHTVVVNVLHKEVAFLSTMLRCSHVRESCWLPVVVVQHRPSDESHILNRVLRVLCDGENRIFNAGQKVLLRRDTFLPSSIDERTVCT